MRFGRVEVTPRAAGWLPPHLTTPSGGMGVLKPAEQVLVARSRRCTLCKPFAQLEPPDPEVGLQPEAVAGGSVLLPGAARDGGHRPPGHCLQLSLLAQINATRPHRGTIFQMNQALTAPVCGYGWLIHTKLLHPSQEPNFV